jgi:predicted nucleotidyltransferase
LQGFERRALISILQVELLPKHDPVIKGITLLDLWDELEMLFEKKVDLLTDQPFKNPIFRKMIKEREVLVYDHASKEILV